MSIVKNIQGIYSGLRCLSLSTSYNATSKAYQDPTLRKPPGPYQLFVIEQFKSKAVVAGGRYGGLAESMKIVGPRWSALPQEKKDEYGTQSVTLKKKFAADNDALSIEELNKIAKIKFLRQEKILYTKLRKRMKKLSWDRPKNSHGIGGAAFELYFGEWIKKDMREHPLTKENGLRMKEGREEFDRLSPAEKQQWKVRATEYQTKRATEYSAWKQKIIEDGRGKEIAYLKRTTRQIKTRLNSEKEDQLSS